MEYGWLGADPTKKPRISEANCVELEANDLQPLQPLRVSVFFDIVLSKEIGWQAQTLTSEMMVGIDESAEVNENVLVNSTCCSAHGWNAPVLKSAPFIEVAWVRRRHPAPPKPHSTADPSSVITPAHKA